MDVLFYLLILFGLFFNICFLWMFYFTLLLILFCCIKKNIIILHKNKSNHFDLVLVRLCFIIFLFIILC
jgi:hypothetical protein